MSDPERSRSNEAVDKIIGNMTAEMQNCDGQYSPLAFTTPPAEPLNWQQPPNPYMHNFHPYANEIQLGYAPQMEQYQSVQNYNYMQSQPQHIFNMNEYKKEIDPLGNMMFAPMQETSMNPNLYQNQNDFVLAAGSDQYNMVQDMNGSEPMYHNQQRTHLLENFVGNWVPNNTGTYSPFGNNVGPFKPSVGGFENAPDKEDVVNTNGHVLEDSGFSQSGDQTFDDKKFHFMNQNVAGKKPRMVAEVKPMRPSYSDVLTKPVPQTVIKPVKTDGKEAKQKNGKENGKKNGSKSDKSQKNSAGALLNRSNTNNDIIKDSTSDKTNTKDPKAPDNKLNNSNSTNSKSAKSQLNRKWVSLDNINDSSSSNSNNGGKDTNGEAARKKKQDDLTNSKSFSKTSTPRKASKGSCDNNNTDNDSSGTNSKSETISNVGKTLKKTTSKFRQKNPDSFGTSDRPPGKRNQRIKRRENSVLCGVIGQKIRQYLKGWWKMTTVFFLWFINLISDICSLSLHVSREMTVNFWVWLCVHWSLFLDIVVTILNRIKLFTWIFDKYRKKEKEKRKKEAAAKNGVPNAFVHGLRHNINMPTTGEEAMKRLLGCKGKDPYSILGVTPTSSDADIKRYYKRQAVLVHPDKNQSPGTEEAFKILVAAFDIIGHPETRAIYDKGIANSAFVERAEAELRKMWDHFIQKMEDEATTIRCSACNKSHRRTQVERPGYAARNCATCKIHHAAREGDIWAEARCFGFLWHYYACMEGGVYDITEWAKCQKDSLKHLKPDVHHVQYRIALGKHSNNNNNAAHSGGGSRKQHGGGSPRTHGATATSSDSKTSPKAADLEHLLNSLYGAGGHHHQQQQSSETTTGGAAAAASTPSSGSGSGAGTTATTTAAGGGSGGGGSRRRTKKANKCC